MKSTLWVLMALIAALLLFTACPRESEGSETQPESAVAASAMQRQPGEQAVEGTETPAETPAEMEEGTPEGEIAAEGEAASEEEAATEEAATEGEAVPAEEENAMAETNTNGVTTVVFETTKGDIVLAVHSDWAPLGAAHFIELVNVGFYNGAPWFRVIDRFVAQCGVSADPAMNEKWGMNTIQDEPVVKGNLRGFVAFGQSSMPNSRSTHIFINYADNSGLDSQGFACFAEVVEGMDIADSLTRCEYRDQGGLAAEGGLNRFKAAYPEADYITKAYVKK